MYALIFNGRATTFPEMYASAHHHNKSQYHLSVFICKVVH